VVGSVGRDKKTHFLKKKDEKMNKKLKKVKK